MTDLKSDRVSQWNQWHEWNAPRYPHSKVIQYVLRHFSERRIPAPKALDLGCGSGANTAFLAETGFDVDAVDIAPIAVERTKHLLDSRSLRAHVAVAGIEEVDFRSATFDLIVSVGVLEFIDNTWFAECLRRIEESLTANGRVVLVFAADGDFRQSSEVAQELGMRFRTQEEVRGLTVVAERMHLNIDEYITTYGNGKTRQVDWLLTGIRS